MVLKRYHTRLEGKLSPRSYEYRVVRKDGSVRWLEVYASLTEFNGKPASQVVHIDITERKEAEDALRESEKRFRLIAETIDEIFYIYDAEKDTTIYLSPAFERVWGISRERIVDSSEHFNAMIHPDDRPRVDDTDELMRAGRPLDYEYRIIRPDGLTRHIWNRGFPVADETGRIRQYVGFGQDVTEWRRAENALKESREYLSQIINCIGDPVFVKDREHKFELVNDAFCTFFDTRREELLGEARLETMPEALATSIWEDEEKVFKTGKESLTEDNLTEWKGAPRIMLSKKSLLTDKDGNQQIIGVMRDITEYKRLEAQFFQAQKMEAVGVLAGGVAHDFNNLLNVINGYSELILEDLDEDNPIRKDLEQIKEAGGRAATLTSQLLAFGRKQVFQPQILDMNNVITQMSSMLRRLIGEHIEFMFAARPDLGMVSADPGQIQQVTMNLAVNARDAMPQGGKLMIETANVDLDEEYEKKNPVAKPGLYVMLAISDTGVGMSAATQARLFEPFFTTKEKGKGTGLGLSTVYGIVRQSNGFISAFSEPGKGTAFKIYFPRVQGNAAGEAAEGKMDDGFRGAETVLVVEDEASVRSLVCRILRDRGYSVLEASEGMEALRIVREHTGEIHLLVSDIIMPGMNGSKLAARIEEVRPGIKALFISGYTGDTIVHDGMLDSKMLTCSKNRLQSTSWQGRSGKYLIPANVRHETQ